MSEIKPGLVPDVKVDYAMGRALGYVSRRATFNAARRAMRWLRAPRNLGARPPSHIGRKIALLKVMAAKT